MLIYHGGSDLRPGAIPRWGTVMESDSIFDV